MIQIGYNNTWLWVAIEPLHNLVLGAYLSSRHRNMIVAAESFLKSLVKSYGKHIVYSDCGLDMVPEACSSSLGLKHILHSFVVWEEHHWKILFSTSRREQNVLMTIILAEAWVVVTYIMYIQMDMLVYVYAKCSN